MPLASVGPQYPARVTLDRLAGLFPDFVLRRD
jgi:hypothetical protein